MATAPVLEHKSLRQQVYEHLRLAINRGNLAPGSFVDLKALEAELGTSRTPLREALLQLELEGFVSVLPRRGVTVRRLTLEDVRHLYEIVGALESVVLVSVAQRIDSVGLERMRVLNREMVAAVRAGDFDTYYARNLAFHDVFLDLSDNLELLRTVRISKQRLYDFPRQRDFVREWEQRSTGEHAELVRLLGQGAFREAADYLRDVHWSYEHQERFIVQYYPQDEAADETGGETR